MEPNPVLESQIKASVSSFAQYIQDHFSGNDVPEVINMMLCVVVLQ